VSVPPVPAREPAPRRPLRQRDILEAFLASLQRGGQDHSSVRLTRNARGETQVEVTVRTGDTAEIVTVTDAATRARQVYDHLCGLYPLPQSSPANGAEQ